MKKIAFVAPWYGENIPGGAETELRGIVDHFHEAGADVEVLTTCVEKFGSDWSKNYYKPGDYLVNGVKTKRFNVRERDTVAFYQVNAKLMQGISINEKEEETFLREMVNSLDLYKYIREKQDEYGLFVYIPYMFGTTYYGVLSVPEKSVVIPCFHEESYIHINLYKKAFENCAGMVYLSFPEMKTANSVFNLKNVKQMVLGAGVETDFDYDAAAFRKKFDIKEPFILYAGRKDEGKNIYLLLKYFGEYKLRHSKDKTKLVLIGGGSLNVPESLKKEVIDLGFVDLQDKYNAYAAAEMLCQPSIHESFSIVIMESWLCRRPVLVHEKCDVTKKFVVDNNAGLYFDNYFEFEGCVDYIKHNPEIAEEMGEKGRKFVLENFAWNVIVEKYTKFFSSLEG